MEFVAHYHGLDTRVVVLIGLEEQWLGVRDPISSGLLSLFFQSGKDVVLGNNGDEDAKLVAVLNSSREERADVIIVRETN